eukprot:Hpha_TRINITY_DN28057_c0_g1::TRINITY_DN28057_c0_g1_i1::g.42533::m.42533
MGGRKKKGPAPAIRRAVEERKEGGSKGVDAEVLSEESRSTQSAATAMPTAASPAYRFAFGAGAKMRASGQAAEGTARVSHGGFTKLGARLGQACIASTKPFTDAAPSALLSILLSAEVDTNEVSVPASVAKPGREVYLGAVPDTLRFTPVREAAVWPSDGDPMPCCEAAVLDAVSERLWGRLLESSVDISVTAPIFGRERTFSVRALFPPLPEGSLYWYRPPLGGTGLSLSLAPSPPGGGDGHRSASWVLPASQETIPGYCAEWESFWEWLQRGG